MNTSSNKKPINDLSEWVKKNEIKPSHKTFFLIHRELIFASLKKGFNNLIIYEWLKSEYNMTMSYTTFNSYVRQFEEKRQNENAQSVKKSKVGLGGSFAYDPSKIEDLDI